MTSFLPKCFTGFNNIKITRIKINVFLLLFIIFSGTIFYAFNYIFLEYIYTFMYKWKIISEKTTEAFVVYTPGCKIPYFHPFDNKIKPYIRNMSLPICNKGKPSLFKSDLTHIYLINNSLIAYNITDIKKLNCCYNEFFRISPKDNKPDNFIKYSNNCYNLTYKTYIKEEFIRVICYYNNLLIYKDMFSFVPIKRLSKSKNPLNVLIIGLDSVSRLNVHRQLKKTVNYIKDLGAIELLGYNKVGYSTYPNLIPVLTGLNETELSDTCLPGKRDYFDKCRFIWDYYKQEGYITAYGEDSAWMGLFNFQKYGFFNQPTDYYYSCFNNHVEKKIGNVEFGNVVLCANSRLIYKDSQDYIKKFLLTMNNHKLPYFSFFWFVSLTHDDLNMPKLGDEDFYKLIKNFNTEGYLNNTALIFMSDHGMRWGGIKKTYQGKLEQRLPFVFIILPDWFKLKYPQGIANLIKNTRKLTTPFDLHETLINLLYPNEETIINNNSRGISLFNEISSYRTCTSAGILKQWCTCQQNININNKNPIIITSAKFAIKYINNKLINYSQCAKLNLAKIIDSKLMTHEGEDFSDSNKIFDYEITLVTVPGNGIFKVVIRFKPDDKVFSVIGSMIRLNVNEKQSYCIDDFHLKLYCYCIKI